MVDLGKLDANEGRLLRVKRYKLLLGLSEDFLITEENIDPYGVRFIANTYNCTDERVSEELLDRQWSNLEERD